MPKMYDTHPDALARIRQLTQMLSGAREHANTDSGLLGNQSAAGLSAIDDEFIASGRSTSAAATGDAS